MFLRFRTDRTADFWAGIFSKVNLLLTDRTTRESNCHLLREHIHVVITKKIKEYSHLMVKCIS